MASEDSVLTLDLVDLPDVILVRVMSFLNLNDRYSLMQTCRRLYDIFQHPSLWYNLKIDNLKTNYPDSNKTELERLRQMFDSVGHCCQELEFNFKGSYEKMGEDVRDFIVDVSEKCRLETLIVNFEYFNLKHKPRANFIGPAVLEDIETLCSLVSRCNRLTSFCLRKWPVFNHTVPSHNEILEALCDNPKLAKLEKLHLYWPDRNETTWAAVKTNQTPEYALKLVSHFRNLTHLSLMSYVLSDKLIRSLAESGRTRLESLRIMVVYKSDIAIPSISESSWSHSAAQGLKVEVVFSARVPSEPMFELLRPSVPISKIHFMTYSRCSPEDLSRIASLYALTLEKYVDEILDGEKSRELMKLVHCCDHLRTLIYKGKINYSTVIELARLKGDNWYRFSIAESSIDFGEQMAGRVDEEQVLKKNDQGEYYSVAMHNWTETDESLAQKEERREKMIARVTEALGCKWEPE